MINYQLVTSILIQQLNNSFAWHNIALYFHFTYKLVENLVLCENYYE